MIFQGMSCFAYLIYILCEDDIMRITHRHKCTLAQSARSNELCRCVKSGFTHIHGDALYNIVFHMQAQYFDSR